MRDRILNRRFASIYLQLEIKCRQILPTYPPQNCSMSPDRLLRLRRKRNDPGDRAQFVSRRCDLFMRRYRRAAILKRRPGDNVARRSLLCSRASRRWRGRRQKLEVRTRYNVPHARSVGKEPRAAFENLRFLGDVCVSAKNQRANVKQISSANCAARESILVVCTFVTKCV